MQLCPHHLAVLALVPAGCPGPACAPPSRLAQVLDVLFDWIYEIVPESASLADCIQRMPCGLEMQIKTVHGVFEALQTQGADALARYFEELTALLDSPDEPANEHLPLRRRSPLAFFVRRCLLTYESLDISEVEDLLASVAAYVAGLPNLRVAHTICDEKQDTLHQILRDICSGCSQRALEGVRRYAERLPSSDAKQTELEEADSYLYLAQIYLDDGMYESAHYCLQEAQQTARSNKDALQLDACAKTRYNMDRLTRRFSVAVPSFVSSKEDDNLDVSGLSPTQPQKAPHNNPIPRGQRVWEAFLGGKPIGALLVDLASSSAPTADDSSRTCTKLAKDEVEEHAVAAFLHTSLGASSVAAAHEEIVIADGGNSGETLSLLINRAMRVARRGDYEAALGMLWSQQPRLSLRACSELQRASYAILRLRADRAYMPTIVQLIDCLLPVASSSSLAGEAIVLKQHITSRDAIEVGETAAPDSIERVEGLLRRARKYMIAERPSQALARVLEALTLSSPVDGQGLSRLYHLARVMLADILLAHGPDGTTKASEALDVCFAGVVAQGDAEISAYAHLTRARVLMAAMATEKNEAALRVALDSLHEARKGYHATGCLADGLRCLKYIAQIQHELGDLAGRDATARLWQSEQASMTGSAGDAALTRAARELNRLADIMLAMSDGIAHHARAV
ncbi:uncharacterized protein L969DRAFT_90503 [Mixia osmundae IAM 14324]|uniref:Anaphase-promoting complex subunit 5 n=1 Tax=Mixia osmundae (strain CBS 9802 / IAM 14324 / JCM 22182 / KY 12970) TaxID=764103 RepID=G7E2M7_MIXOS|nr:uncharacterized protein L969DRAFT_90503 [Mixia osmundae IAM 14324]KEI36952.1 hypothetical protein L969DRAFT_90503 [Mixia osmundae IAM 14324]GAA97087.1 hypothetical protein E5Q_03762 [Mixia osmundae IAM 14324]